MNSNLMKPKDVINELNITYQTLLNWVKSGKIKPVVINGRRYFRRSDVEAIKSARKCVETTNVKKSIEDDISKYIELWNKIKAGISVMMRKDINIGDVVPKSVFEDVVYLITKRQKFLSTPDGIIMKRVLKCFDVVTEIDASTGKISVIGYKILK